LVDTGSDVAPPGDSELTPFRELRRGYHDRIAQVREDTLRIVDEAASAVYAATRVLLDQDRDGGAALAARLTDLAPAIAAVDSEVLELLALQAPVARDLRIILAARDIAQTAALCVGLCQTLATRISCAAEVLNGSLPPLIESVGTCAAAVLRRAQGAWATLDDEQAHLVVPEAQRCRAIQRELLTELLRLKDVPVETGLNLGLASRAFGRLTDHGEEIAERVLFAVTGETPSFSQTGP
jgi:phosphate transport system protein